MKNRKLLGIKIASLTLAFATSISVHAVDALYVDPAGNVGVGTSAPAFKLQVEAPTNAYVLVKNTSAVAAERAMFTLANNGKTRFIIQNGANVWSFDNSGNRFQISKVGTGVPEFEVYDNGDGVFSGDVYANQFLLTSARETKTDFAPVDGQNILKQLDSLDILSWRYKEDGLDDRHIGPIAEDFQEVFSLGDGKHISAVDASGIAFAGIKALIEENTSLKARLERLESQQAKMQEVMFKVLENQQGQAVMTSTAMN